MYIYVYMYANRIVKDKQKSWFGKIVLKET